MKTGFATKSKTMTALVLQWRSAVPGTQKLRIAHRGITRATNSIKYGDLATRRMSKVSRSWSMIYGTYGNHAGTFSHRCAWRMEGPGNPSPSISYNLA